MLSDKQKAKLLGENDSVLDQLKKRLNMNSNSNYMAKNPIITQNQLQIHKFIMNSTNNENKYNNILEEEDSIEQIYNRAPEKHDFKTSFLYKSSDFDKKREEPIGTPSKSFRRLGSTPGSITNSYFTQQNGRKTKEWRKKSLHKPCSFPVIHSNSKSIKRLSPHASTNPSLPQPSSQTAPKPKYKHKSLKRHNSSLDE